MLLLFRISILFYLTGLRLRCRGLPLYQAWSPGMQQYWRNDECRPFRYASKLVFFYHHHTHFLPPNICKSIQCRAGTPGAPHSNQKKSSSHISEMQIWQTTNYICCHQCNPLFIFSVQFQQFCLIFYVLTFDVYEKLLLCLLSSLRNFNQKMRLIRIRQHDLRSEPEL